MILLDTHVVSELMKKQPHTRVLHWLEGQKTAQLYLTAITVAEIRRGLALLPEGTRRTGLEQAFDQFLRFGSKERILAFSASTARIYAPVYQSRMKSGLGISELDLLIATTAASISRICWSMTTREAKCSMSE